MWQVLADLRLAGVNLGQRVPGPELIKVIALPIIDSATRRNLLSVVDEMELRMTLQVRACTVMNMHGTLLLHTDSRI
jgi:hypothetical protein